MLSILLHLGCAKSSRITPGVEDAGARTSLCETDGGCEDAEEREAISPSDAREEALGATSFDATFIDAEVESPDPDILSNDASAARPACWEVLGEQNCIKHPACDPAYSSGGDGNAVVFLGCYSADKSCDDAVVYARDPDRSGCVQLNSSCIPDGWEYLATTPCTEFCTSLSGRLLRCEQTEGCTPVFGREARTPEPRFAGCIPTPQQCDQEITCARVSSGRCLEYPNSCLPDRAQVAPCDSSGCPAEPAIGTVVDCDIETVTDFLAKDKPLIDCGVLDPEASEIEQADLHACVAEAQAQGLAYRAIWPLTGGDSIVRNGSFGMVQNGEFAVYRFSSDSAGVSPNGALSWWFPCESHDVPSECSAMVCIECVVIDETAPCECRWNSMREGPASLFCSQEVQ